MHRNIVLDDRAAVAHRGGMARSFDRRAVTHLAAAHLVNDVNQAAVLGLLPFLVAQRGLGYATASSLVTVLQLSGAIVQPVLGHRADARPSRFVMPVVLVAGAIAVAAIGLVDSAAMTAAVLIAGVATAAFHPESTRLVRRAAGGRISTALGIYALGGNLGTAIGPVVATALVGALGWGGPCLLIGPAVIVAWLVRGRSSEARGGAGTPFGPPMGGVATSPVGSSEASLGTGTPPAALVGRVATSPVGSSEASLGMGTLFAPPMGRVATSPVGSTDAKCTAGTPPAALVGRVASPVRSSEASLGTGRLPAPPMAQLATSPVGPTRAAASRLTRPSDPFTNQSPAPRWSAFFRCVVILILRAGFSTCITAFVPLYLVRVRGWQPGVAGLTLTIVLLVGVIAGVVAGPLADRIGVRRVLLAALVPLGPLFLGFTLLPAAAALPCLLLVGAGTMAVYVIALGAAQDCLPGRTGLAAGVAMGTGTALGSVAVLVVGHIADGAGLTTALRAVAVLPVIAALLAAKQRRRTIPAAA
jgi:MFS family permease